MYNHKCKEKNYFQIEQENLCDYFFKITKLQSKFW